MIRTMYNIDGQRFIENLIISYEKKEGLFVKSAFVQFVGQWVSPFHIN